MRSFVLVLLALAAVSAQQQRQQQPYFDNDLIDDLQKLVDYPTKMKLKMLEDNYYMPRSQKKQEFEQILNSQPQQVQDAYIQRQAYEAMKQQQRQLSLQQRMQYMPPAVANAYKQMEQARSDLSLSDMQFGQKKRQIFGQLSWTDRRQFNSNSEEDFD